VAFAVVLGGSAVWTTYLKLSSGVFSLSYLVGVGFILGIWTP
jgi:hypothetical protein